MRKTIKIGFCVLVCMAGQSALFAKDLQILDTRAMKIDYIGEVPMYLDNGVPFLHQNGTLEIQFGEENYGDFPNPYRFLFKPGVTDPEVHWSNVKEGATSRLRWSPKSKPHVLYQFNVKTAFKWPGFEIVYKYDFNRGTNTILTLDPFLEDEFVPWYVFDRDDQSAYLLGYSTVGGMSINALYLFDSLTDTAKQIAINNPGLDAYLGGDDFLDCNNDNCVIFNLKTFESKSIPPSGTGRNFMSKLPDGRMLWTVGSNPPKLKIYNRDQNTWSDGPTIPFGERSLLWIELDDDQMVLVGADDSGEYRKVQLLNLRDLSIKAGPDLLDHYFGSLVHLGDGKVLAW